MILRSQRPRDTALKSVNYADFKAVSRGLCEQELQLLFQIISCNFDETNNYDFCIFL